MTKGKESDAQSEVLGNPSIALMRNNRGIFDPSVPLGLNVADHRLAASI